MWTVTIPASTGFLTVSASSLGAPIFVTARSLEAQSEHGTATLQLDACEVSTVSVGTPPRSCRDETQGSGLASEPPETAQSAIAAPSRKTATLASGVPAGRIDASSANTSCSGLEGVAGGAVIAIPTPSALNPGDGTPPDVDMKDTRPPCGLVSVTTSGCPGLGVGGLAVATLAPPSTKTEVPASDANNPTDTDASPWVSWDPTTSIVCV